LADLAFKSKYSSIAFSWLGRATNHTPIAFALPLFLSLEREETLIAT
jgi:hypothetical protein